MHFDRIHPASTPPIPTSLPYLLNSVSPSLHFFLTHQVQFALSMYSCNGVCSMHRGYTWKENESPFPSSSQLPITSWLVWTLHGPFSFHAEIWSAWSCHGVCAVAMAAVNSCVHLSCCACEKGFLAVTHCCCLL